MMNRLIWHHTGGGYTPSAVDRLRYHFLIDGDGQVVPGVHPIEANAPGKPLRAGKYAAHTLGLNTGSIGGSIAAMHDAQWRDPFGSTRFPVRPVQVDALIAESARLCIRYGITPHQRFTLSHAEVEPTLGVRQKAKWDFDYPPRGGPTLRDPVGIGDELRAELARALAGMRTAPYPSPTSPRPTIRQGATGAAVRDLQTLLGLRADGVFGPVTAAAVRALQTRNQLLPDGIVGPMTWATLARKT